MILAHRVALNGVQLDELDERINIKSVAPGAGKDSISAEAPGTQDGNRITGRRRDTLDIVVKFSMVIGPDELRERVNLLEKINAWAAGGGWLTVNYKENRQVLVVCAQAPGEGDAFEWTTVYQITFRAYSVPFWTDVAETAVKSKVAGSGSMTISVPGSAETVADVTVENKSGMTINNLSLTIAGKTMTFSGLNLGGSQKLIIDHLQTADLYVFRARIGSTSVLGKRTGADEFRVKPGDRGISFSADRAVQVTVGVRGRYV
jgi:hypothetical protein